MLGINTRADSYRMQAPEALEYIKVHCSIYGYCSSRKPRRRNESQDCRQAHVREIV